ncbi:MAG: 2,3-bisphosphoglycerate-independent phosphoglycerate mutase [Dehalococcoidia bacterium]|nr:2,3-bisphosphoglycerate-independent phosphoglycerate mutase [Dehalococcoidia bacterium]MCA9849393.1 2,3-bisphosphoglycerate-independent phosphoglycerate mutase [Dehalococcoidia bacterium]MCB9484002.1 2,3-bisphosphoglycerate-independent phosphoglycerate mutase [Dehalococcoidia bacterium]
MELDLIRRLSQPADTKVVLCVLDGLGGIQGPRGRTELEEANLVNLDRLAEAGCLGRTLPVGYGVTPGSGPGHIALFGYDPLTYEIGRGALEATGIGFDLGPNDVAARGNLCDIDAEGRVTDRRAGRLPTEETTKLCEQLRAIQFPGVEVFVEPVQDQRFVLVLRGEGLSEAIAETDPQREGVPPIEATHTSPEGERTAGLVREWIAKAREILGGRERGNGVLLRGWSKRPEMPPFPELWKLRAAAVTVYPMYRGVAKLCGMTSIEGAHSFDEQLDLVKQHWDEFDFFFVHFKYTDSAGEDGDFRRKVEAINQFDAALPKLLNLEPNVLVVTGDHSTPAVMAAHSFHPVPLLLWGDLVRSDNSHQFSEPSCVIGELGTFPAKETLPIAFAHAGRLAKYGA